MSRERIKVSFRGRAAECGDTYCDAEFTTKGFTLKAPKIRVKDIPAWVKVTVVGKVRG